MNIVLLPSVFFCFHFMLEATLNKVEGVAVFASDSHFIAGIGPLINVKQDA